MLPIGVSGKVNFVSLKTSAGVAASPVPVKLTVKGVVLKLLAMDKVAARAPAVVGVNCRYTLQLDRRATCCESRRSHPGARTGQRDVRGSRINGSYRYSRRSGEISDTDWIEADIRGATCARQDQARTIIRIAEWRGDRNAVKRHRRVASVRHRNGQSAAAVDRHRSEIQLSGTELHHAGAEPSAADLHSRRRVQGIGADRHRSIARAALGRIELNLDFASSSRPHAAGAIVGFRKFGVVEINATD